MCSLSERKYLLANRSRAVYEHLNGNRDTEAGKQIWKSYFLKLSALEKRCDQCLISK